jgi:hypothetical protein
LSDSEKLLPSHRPSHRTAIEAALAELPPGTRVRLKMYDGREVHAIAGEGTEVQPDATAEQIDLDQIEHLLVDLSSEYPE